MDTALVVITLVSLGLTAALLVYAARLQREQRARSEARVVALAAEIESLPPSAADTPRLEQDDRQALVVATKPDAGHPREWTATAPAIHTATALADGSMPPSASRALVQEPTPVLIEREPLAEAEARVRDDASGAAIHLFEPPAGSAPSVVRRFRAPIIGALVVGIALTALWTTVRPAAHDRAALRGTGSTSHPIELVSLTQSRSGETLTVSGVVRNPRESTARSGLSAVVFVFDATGSFLTSARAPIDYQVLAPGDESPFSVPVPRAARAARYRVSFRNDQEIVPHVDRRDGPPIPQQTAARAR
jgi:hypothetical protein